MTDDAKRAAEQATCDHVPTLGEHAIIECQKCGKTLLEGADPKEYWAAWREIQRRISKGFRGSK